MTDDVDATLDEIFAHPKTEIVPVQQETLPDTVDDLGYVYPIEAVSAAEEKKQIDNDVEYVRAQVRNMMQAGVTAVDELAKVSRESQHPRTYEVLHGMIRTVGDMGDKLLQVHKTKREIKQMTDPESLPSGSVFVDKAVFVGTTADLLKKAKEEKS